MALIKSTDSDFESLLQQNERVVVKYYADWCGNCKLFAPKFRRLSDDERFKAITFIDVNAEENPIARNIAGVNNLPFFATFKNGGLVDTLAASKEESVVGIISNLN